MFILQDMSLDDFDLADAIIEESRTPEEALAKMINAERILDTALHKVKTIDRDRTVKESS